VVLYNRPAPINVLCYLWGKISVEKLHSVCRELVIGIDFSSFHFHFTLHIHYYISPDITLHFCRRGTVAVIVLTVLGEYDVWVLFCWLFISMYACNETSLTRYLSSVYSFTIPLHVSGLLIAHHQEVTMCIHDNWYVLYVLLYCWRARRLSAKTYNTYQLSHTCCV
jgi:hypothetical protein